MTGALSREKPYVMANFLAGIAKRLDALWREVVRERDGAVCVHCHRRAATAVHHIFSRRHNSTRWDPINGVHLCFYCHIRVAHEDPEVFRDFVVPHLGQRVYDALKMRALSPALSVDETLITLSLREELKTLKAARQNKPR